MRQLSLLLVLLLVGVASTNSASNKVVEVDVICKEASNPLFCANILNSNPGGAKGVDLVDLAIYTIDVFDYNSSNTKSLIHKLIDQSGGNVTEINYYHRCAVDFDSTHGITAMLIFASTHLNHGHYSAMVKDTTNIMKKILECSHSLHKNKTSPLLAKSVDVLRLVGQVLQIISKYLNHG
ncbi:hypothetical protein RYX36_009047 [Vicia faba]